jgi:hypothetical protein
VKSDLLEADEVLARRELARDGDGDRGQRVRRPGEDAVRVGGQELVDLEPGLASAGIGGAGVRGSRHVDLDGAIVVDGAVR